MGRLIFNTQEDTWAGVHAATMLQGTTSKQEKCRMILLTMCFNNVKSRVIQMTLDD